MFGTTLLWVVFLHQLVLQARGTLRLEFISKLDNVTVSAKDG